MEEMRITGDGSTGDVVVRLTGADGREKLMYSRSQLLAQKSRYFANMISGNAPTETLDSRKCLAVCCQGTQFDHHVQLLLAINNDCSVDDLWDGVKKALGILQGAIELGCPQIIFATVNYLGGIPWDESEEQKILGFIARFGKDNQAILEPICARLRLGNTESNLQLFTAALKFATSTPPSNLNDIKLGVQEEIVYLLSQEDGGPLFPTQTKNIVAQCMNELLINVERLLDEIISDPMTGGLPAAMADVIWALNVMITMKIKMTVFITNWFDISEKLLQVMNDIGQRDDIAILVIEQVAAVFQALRKGKAVLPSAKRLQVLTLCLPFTRWVKPQIQSTAAEKTDYLALWQTEKRWESLETDIGSVISTLPFSDQANVLAQWFGEKKEDLTYPNLVAAFKFWCRGSRLRNQRSADAN